MESPPVATAELQAWLIALAVGIGIVIAVLGEIWIRQMEWTVEDQRQVIADQSADIEELRQQVALLSKELRER